MDESNDSRVYTDAKKNVRTNLLICLAIFIGVSIYYAFSGNSGVNLDIGEEAITVTDSSEGIDFSITVDYDDVTDIYIMTAEELQLGDMVTGYDGKKLQFGEWNSGVYGKVSVYAKPGVTEYTVMVTDDMVFAMNLESNETTEAFYDAMCELLTENGYSYNAHRNVSVRG